MIGRERGSQSYAMLGTSKKELGCDEVVSGDCCRIWGSRGQSPGDRLVVSNLNVCLI